jgi:hypothetical protein
MIKYTGDIAMDVKFRIKKYSQVFNRVGTVYRGFTSFIMLLISVAANFDNFQSVTEFLTSISVLDGILRIYNARDKVNPISITKCFAKAGFVIHPAHFSILASLLLVKQDLEEWLWLAVRRSQESYISGVLLGNEPVCRISTRMLLDRLNSNKG